MSEETASSLNPIWQAVHTRASEIRKRGFAKGYKEGYAQALADAANIVLAGSFPRLDKRCIELSKAYYKEIKALLSRGSR